MQIVINCENSIIERTPIEDADKIIKILNSLNLKTKHTKKFTELV